MVWTRAVRDGAIPSRRAGTDAAMLAVLRRHRPARLLDVGCGEGWLVRAAAAAVPGCRAVGVDGSAALVRAARALDPAGSYLEAGYDAICRDPVGILGDPYDLLICNFALLGDGTGELLAALAQVTGPGGALAIQTLHPWTTLGQGPYECHWREEDYAAMGSDGWQPMPWLYRTLADWSQLIARAGWVHVGIEEPRAAGSPLPLSLLLVCRPGPI